MVVAIVGIPGSPIHFWKRKKTWRGACAFIRKVTSQLAPLAMPAHIISEEIASTAKYANGESIYPRKPEYQMELLSAGVVSMGGGPLDITNQHLIVVIGDPITDMDCVWKKCANWSEAIYLLKNAENYIIENDYPPNRQSVHVYPEIFASQLRRNADQRPIFERSLYERLQQIELN